MKNLYKLLDKIEYDFNNIEYLQTALTHSSYASEHNIEYEKNNERLEFIGDAFIDAVIGQYLFEMMPTAREGTLSRNRADVVCEESLADMARNINLGQYINLGKGEDTNGGRDKDSILADAFEALIGAIILDGGYDEGKRIILKLLNKQVKLAINGKITKDYKSKLQEKIQGKYSRPTIEYEIVSESGPDHCKIFVIELNVNGKILGRGQGRSKIKAEQEAAKMALTKGEI